MELPEQEINEITNIILNMCVDFQLDPQDFFHQSFNGLNGEISGNHLYQKYLDLENKKIGLFKFYELLDSTISNLFICEYVKSQNLDLHENFENKLKHAFNFLVWINNMNDKIKFETLSGYNFEHKHKHRRCSRSYKKYKNSQDILLEIKLQAVDADGTYNLYKEYIKCNNLEINSISQI